MDGDVSLDELRRGTRLLEALARDPVLLSKLPEADRIAFVAAAGQVSRPGRLELKRRDKALRRERRAARQANDRQARASSQIRLAREAAAVYVPPARMLPVEAARAPRRVLERPRHCYVCKADYRELHFFYDSMCAACGDLNYVKRFQTASLAGRVAVITGARLKIGYQAALMLLRAGARVIATTRFPHDAALRYSREPDFAEWSSRLSVHGLDLRHSPSVELFVRFLDGACDRLDILVNNAAQTVRRPPAFYAHLLELESRNRAELPAPLRGLLKDNVDAGVKTGRALLPLAHGEATASRELFPEGRTDADLQQIDLRRHNSWRMRLADVPAAEMLEVQLVNAVAPFILCSQLKPLMLRDRPRNADAKHIVNVSAMEGVFSRGTKTDKHPHTNMAKAALNMMTLTSARDYAADGIFMNAVDTGWVTDEDPAHLSRMKQDQHDFQPPLDIVDGAARVCDPVFSALLTGRPQWGRFYKDYAPSDW